MKVAVASQNRKSVTTHLGRCRKFWIYTIEDKKVLNRELLELPKELSFHESSPHDTHPLDDVALIICGGMGENLKNRLARKSIGSFVTEESDPDKAVVEYLKQN